MKRNFAMIALIILIAPILYAGGTGLALSGGGARAMAHIGVLKVLDEEGIQIDYIAGTSTGALIASLYACGMSGAEIEEIFLDINWRQNFDDRVERDQKMINFKHWQEGSNMALRIQNFTPVLPEGLTPGNTIINKLFDLTWEYCDCVNFDSLSIPLRVPATDVIKGETALFKEGHLHEVIFASLCFPTLLKPFGMNDTYYIDGGILMNLPVQPLRDMGADLVIGVSANSPLKNSAYLNSIVDILEQTAGVAMKANIKDSRQQCDLLIDPDLQNYGMLRFESDSEIIAAGEAAARAVLPYMQNLPRRQKPIVSKQRVADRILLKSISIEGNEYLKEDEIMSYLDLEAGKTYTHRQVKRSFARAFNTDLFEIFYPVLKRVENGYHLIVKVQEKHRAFLKMNFHYNTSDNIGLQILLDYKNLLQSNSRLISSLMLAQNNELCLDYVKNFGDDYGFYYHIFTYLKEIPIYTYDKDFMKTEKVQALEAGLTDGIGIFFKRSLILEFYNFLYDKKLYRDIGLEELQEPHFTSWGGGIKLYFETLDDLVFGMKGIRLLSKYTVAKSEDGDAGRYQKSMLRFEFLHPLTGWASFRYKFEYGSYFEKAIPYDPFYIGGIDSFMGFHPYERSSTVYKINSASLRFNPCRNFYLEALINNLNLGESDNWELGDELEWAGGLILGYQFPLLPLRLGLAMSENDEFTGYVNVGYEFDMFEFSRR